MKAASKGIKFREIGRRHPLDHIAISSIERTLFRASSGSLEISTSVPRQKLQDGIGSRVTPRWLTG